MKFDKRSGLLSCRIKFGHKLGKIWIVALSMLLLCAHAMAQTAAEGVWKGVLHTAAGAPVAGAKIKLAGTGSSSEAITGKDGQFDFASLPTGQ